MAISLLKVTVVLSSFATASAARRVVDEIGVQQKGQLEFGSKIQSRFDMLHVLWRQDLSTKRIEHVPLPAVVTKNFDNEEELYAGSFGEAWAASDKATGKRVVLKMFYTTAGGQRQHITWQRASGDEQLKSQLEDAAGECEIAREMQSFAKSDATGASRLMQCYEDHVTRGTSLTKHRVSDTDELFQVLEDCGGKPLSKWMEAQVESGLAVSQPAVYLTLTLQLFKQLMEGLDYMSSHSMKWVHHDLKPDNAVVKPLGDGSYVLKIIDFGSVTQVSTYAASHPIVSTVAYAPSEWFPIARGYDARHPSSFDTYQAGNILDELVTGKLFYEKIAARSSPPTVVEVSNCVSHQRLRAGYPAHAMFVRDQVYQQMEKQCIQTISFDKVKGSSGAEHSITGQWGKDTTKTVKSYVQTTTQHYDILGRLVTTTYNNPKYESVNKRWGEADLTNEIESLAFGDVQSELSGVASLYSARAQRKGWYPTFMRMVAWDSAVRATPREVLDSSFLHTIQSIADPDFNAEEAQASSNMQSTTPTQQTGQHHQNLPHGHQIRGSVEVAQGESPVVPCPGQHLQQYAGRLCLLQANGHYQMIN